MWCYWNALERFEFPKCLGERTERGEWQRELQDFLCALMVDNRSGDVVVNDADEFVLAKKELFGLRGIAARKREIVANSEFLLYIFRGS